MALGVSNKREARALTYPFFSMKPEEEIPYSSDSRRNASAGGHVSKVEGAAIEINANLDHFGQFVLRPEVLASVNKVVVVVFGHDLEVPVLVVHNQLLQFLILYKFLFFCVNW